MGGGGSKHHKTHEDTLEILRPGRTEERVSTGEGVRESLRREVSFTAKAPNAKHINDSVTHAQLQLDNSSKLKAVRRDSFQVQHSKHK